MHSLGWQDWGLAWDSPDCSSSSSSQFFHSHHNSYLSYGKRKDLGNDWPKNVLTPWSPNLSCIWELSAVIHLLTLRNTHSYLVLRRLTSFVGSRSIEKTLYMHFLCEACNAISPFHRWRKRHAEKSCLILFPSLQEYCKIKKTEETAFPSIYIGLKDKLSGIRKVITDSTLHLIQLLESYKEKLQEFSREGEELSRMVMRKEETWEGREKDPFQSHSLARSLMILISTLFYNCNLKEVNWPYCISISVTSFWGCRRLGFKWILCQPGVFSSRVCLVHGVCPGSQTLQKTGERQPVSWVLPVNWTGAIHNSLIF